VTTAQLVRALAADVPADSEHILDAALDLAAASGLRNLTMEDVARGAGVGRMTVYRRFGNRDALVDALTARELRRCLAELDGASSADAPIEEQVAAGFATAIRLSREHPLLSRLARVEPDTVLGAFNADGGALLQACAKFLGMRLRASQAAGVLAADARIEELSELCVRVAVSFVLLPESALDLDDPELGRRLLGPLMRHTA
jgi:AcrR family transcriptional regulator